MFSLVIFHAAMHYQIVIYRLSVYLFSKILTLPSNIIATQDLFAPLVSMVNLIISKFSA